MRNNAREREIAEVARLYGTPQRRTHEIVAHSPDFTRWVVKLTRRRGEIVLVVPRGEGRVLLHTKPHYPDRVYRLPTGGMHPGERIVDAARREAREELGYLGEIVQFIGVLEYVIRVGRNQFEYPSYIIELGEFKGIPQPTDTQERISGFRDAAPNELRQIARQLKTLPGNWAEWGRFRAIPHEILAQLLSGGQGQG